MNGRIDKEAQHNTFSKFILVQKLDDLHTSIKTILRRWGEKCQSLPLHLKLT